MRILLTSILLTVSYYLSAQNFYISLHQAIGFERQDVTVGSNTTEMPLTSMLGLSAGFDKTVVGNFIITGSLGYYINASTNRSSTNGNVSKSSHSFNVKRISLGIGQNFIFDEKKASLRLSAGLDFNFPGTLNSKNDNNELGKVSYENTTGFYFQLSIPITVSEKMSVAPGVIYRSYNLTAASWEGGDLANLNDTLKDINGNAIELGVTLFF